MVRLPCLSVCMPRTIILGHKYDSGYRTLNERVFLVLADDCFHALLKAVY